uniref:Uncharacterized protein n=1 Tax=Knipowitschia caucasica TaxID=637954 RepID=A0AAV2LGV8_KNICA
MLRLRLVPKVWSEVCPALPLPVLVHRSVPLCPSLCWSTGLSHSAPSLCWSTGLSHSAPPCAGPHVCPTLPLPVLVHRSVPPLLSLCPALPLPSLFLLQSQSERVRVSGAGTAAALSADVLLCLCQMCASLGPNSI